MNKKGFTLVELLAVIVILAVVMLIGSSSISAVKKNIDKGMFEKKLDLIISGARNYGQDNKEKFLNSSGTSYNKTLTMTVTQLIAAGNIETEETELKSIVGSTNCPREITVNGAVRCPVITNPVEGNIVNSLTIKIYMEHNRVYACIPWTTANKNTVLKDKSCSRSRTGDTYTYTNCEYSDLNYYCT